jgi:O-antigen/teichoic acid export membrane protein
MSKVISQMRRNLGVYIISFILNVSIGLLLVPYLIKYLGIAAYGLIPLAMIFTDYINIINVSINSAVGRFFLIEIQNNNWKKANIIFNSAFWGVLGLIIIQIPLLIYIISELNVFVEIPNGFLSDATSLFILTFAGYLISLISSVLNTSMFAHNRLDLSRKVDIVRVTTRIAIVILLFNLRTPSLLSVGIANVIAALCAFIYSFYWNRKLTPELHFSLKSFSFSYLKSIYSMGGWIILNQVGYLLFVKVDLLLINKLMGSQSSGEYAALMQWNILIRTFAGILSGILVPVIITFYAKKEFVKMQSYVNFSIKHISLILIILCSIISGFSKPILLLWLGNEYVSKSFVLIAMTLPLAFSMGTLSTLALNKAHNKVAIPGIITLLAGLLNFIINYQFLRAGYGYLSIALVGGSILLLKNLFFSPMYSANVMKIPLLSFLKDIPLNFAFLVFIFTPMFLYNEYYSITTFIELIFTISISLLLIIPLSYFLIINKKDRVIINKLIKNKIK